MKHYLFALCLLFAGQNAFALGSKPQESPSMEAQGFRKARTPEQLERYKDFESYHGLGKLANAEDLKKLDFYHFAHLQRNTLRFEYVTGTHELLASTNLDTSGSYSECAGLESAVAQLSQKRDELQAEYDNHKYGEGRDWSIISNELRSTKTTLEQKNNDLVVCKRRQFLLRSPIDPPLDLNALSGINLLAAQTWEMMLKCSGGSYELARRSYFEHRYSCIDSGAEERIKRNLGDIENDLLKNFVNSSQIKYTHGFVKIANLHPLLIQLIVENLISELTEMKELRCDTRTSGASINNCVFVKMIRNYLLNTEKHSWDSDRDEVITRYGSDPGFQRLRRVANLMFLFGLVDSGSKESCMSHGFWPIFSHGAVYTLLTENKFFTDVHGLDFKNVIVNVVGKYNGYKRCTNIELYDVSAELPLFTK